MVSNGSGSSGDGSGKAKIKFQEIKAPRIFRQSENEGGKVVRPTHRPSLPQEISMVFISVRG